MNLREKTNIQICEENGLKNVFLTNVAEETTTKNKIRATMQIISKILCGTLGPYGSTTIIQDRDRRHLPTKDGYDLMNRIVIDDEVARTILDILRNISGDQVAAVGDGSTSAVVIASALYEVLTNNVIENTGDKGLFEDIAPKDIVDFLNFIEEQLEKILLDESLPVSDDMHELDKIATIAANNDKETGKTIADLYRKVGKYGFITTDVIETTEKDKFEIREGITWRRPYIDDCFVYGKGSKKIDHDNPYIFLTTKFLSQGDLPLLADVIGKAAKDERELLIVCNGADEDVRTFFKKNRTKHLDPTKRTPELVFTVVDIDQVSVKGKITLKDIALLSGCEVFDPLLNTMHNEPYYLANQDRFTGKAARAIITNKETQIIFDKSLLTDEQIKNIKDHIDELKHNIDELTNIPNRTMDEESDLFNFKTEYNTLLGNTAIYRVGGKTLTERMSRERLIEDAILACKSTLNHGYIYGCNLAIPKAITVHKEEIVKKLIEKYPYVSTVKDSAEEFFSEFLNVIEHAFLQSYRHVLENASIPAEMIDNIIEEAISDTSSIKAGSLYNLKKHAYENLTDTDVINSVETDLNIMRTCISIIGILGTSNQFITLNFSISDAIKKE